MYLGLTIKNSSIDGTLRMWSDRNKLVRKINLGLPVKSLSVSGSNGDCLISFEDSNAIRHGSTLKISEKSVMRLKRQTEKT